MGHRLGSEYLLAGNDRADHCNPLLRLTANPFYLERELEKPLYDSEIIRLLKRMPSRELPGITEPVVDRSDHTSDQMYRVATYHLDKSLIRTIIDQATELSLSRAQAVIPDHLQIRQWVPPYSLREHRKRSASPG